MANIKILLSNGNEFNFVIEDEIALEIIEQLRILSKWKIKEFEFRPIKSKDGKINLIMIINKLPLYFIVDSFNNMNEIEEFIKMLKSDPYKNIFKYVIIENLKKNNTPFIYPEIVKYFKDYIIKIGDTYIPKPEFFDNELLRILKANKDKIVHVKRTEIPDVRPGVLGSMVRKGAIQFKRQSDTTYYYPLIPDKKLNKREIETYNRIKSIYNEKLNKYNNIISEIEKRLSHNSNKR